MWLRVGPGGAVQGWSSQGGGGCSLQKSCYTHSPVGLTDAASKVTEQEWREKAKKDLEEWNQRQSEQVEKNKINNR